jgi:murein DD-endopeptidase MepM/ murein hydrolase activator NlpD
MLATAGGAALMPLPLRAMAASRPSLSLFFPQDPIVTWFEPTYGLVKADGRRHLGIDLMAPKLTPVYAIADGTVSRVANTPRAGRHTIVDHADGWQSWYLHLNNDDPGRDNGRADWSLTVASGVDEGNRVLAGQLLGFVGDSGNAEGTLAHTHFELHLGARTVNPYPYLLESRAVALAEAEKLQLAETVETLCHPGGAAPSVDGWVCPVVESEAPGIPRGVSGLF